VRIDVLTLFPGLFAGPLATSIPGRAAKAGAVAYHLHDIRDHTADKHGKVDQPPYGGGPGMVLQCQPVWDALQHANQRADQDPPQAKGECPTRAPLRGSPEPPAPTHRLIHLTPQGRPLTQPLVHELAAADRLTLLCGHYEGFDERLLDRLRDTPPGLTEISLGDYVLSGGELPALVLIDAVVRLLPGVLGDPRSAHDESFSPSLDGGLDFPHYTRPPTWDDRQVPDVLLSGNHARIDAWRREQSRQRTAARRPDLDPTPPPSNAKPVASKRGAQPAPILTLRDATPDDAPQIAALHRAAFAASPHGYAGEDELVTRCDADGETIFSHVACLPGPAGDRVVGHALWTGTHPTDQPGIRGMLGVGPIAVAPAWQRRGVGSALLRHGIQQARDARVHLLLVLGDPAFYARFGFVPAADLGFDNVYHAGHAYQALALRDPLPAGWAPSTLTPRPACFHPDALADLDARHRPPPP
jgi:tRNA (guanine37-N1)-methyltransferase